MQSYSSKTANTSVPRLTEFLESDSPEQTICSDSSMLPESKLDTILATLQELIGLLNSDPEPSEGPDLESILLTLTTAVENIDKRLQSMENLLARGFGLSAAD